MRNVLITGGSGSFGRAFTRYLLDQTPVERVVVYSRDEFKQLQMRTDFQDDDRLRFFIGDVRDIDRLTMATRGIDTVIHAAALKQVPAAEYNPFEAVKTNVLGAQNVITACLSNGVKHVVALSTDKASSPVNLYGATKLVSDKLFVAANSYAGDRPTRFAVVRYGNVVGSRGSVVPFFLDLVAKGQRLPITDPRMTRFWITLDEAVAFVAMALRRMHGGELFVPKIPSFRVVDLAEALWKGHWEIVGIRPGEKLHEEMISVHDARRTLDLADCYAIQPEADWWPRMRTIVPDDFAYASDTNPVWLSVNELRSRLADLQLL